MDSDKGLEILSRLKPLPWLDVPFVVALIIGIWGVLLGFNYFVAADAIAAIALVLTIISAADYLLVRSHGRMKTFLVVLAFSLVLFSMGLYVVHARHKTVLQDADQVVALQGQITQLVSASSFYATHNDIATLSEQLQALGHPIPTHAVTTNAPHTHKTANPTAIQNEHETTPPATQSPETLRFVQRQVPSNDPALPFALQVIVQTNGPSVPVSFIFDCTSTPEKLDFFLAGTSTYMGIAKGLVGISPFLKIESPQLTSASPLVVTLTGKTPFQVTGIRSY